MVGPTAGYLIGFLFLTWIGGIFAEKYTWKTIVICGGYGIGNDLSLCLWNNMVSDFDENRISGLRYVYVYFRS